MALHKFWNATDHSVTIDGHGRQVDGGGSMILDASVKEVADALALGLLVDQGPYRTDTNSSSDQIESSGPTLDDSTASTKKSSTKSKEK